MSTHPIAGEVPNTEAADSIFDGITYSKGAAVLRQLLSLMGEEKFSAAMKKYFEKFAFKNAALEDLLAFMEQEFDSKKYGFSI